ncbi:beta-1,3-glucan-binding protein-like [Sitodiplosis mosellana]|uniref:beta-1,3-glucan-binding protein-like n=1 Tax=Sitodiplosis mosellana TaxID=263140 RepID=UPI0024448894|nr:beta-1,3-glucan-binding protein-like [Sitodiplosis mosellana]
MRGEHSEKIMLKSIVVLLSISAFSFADDCRPSATTASGWAAPEKICAGQVIFKENFDTLDKNKWKPEVTLGGGGNGEFQWYDVDNENSFAKDGKLHIKPTLTADKIGQDAVEHGHVSLNGCTDQDKANCERQAGGNTIINPVKSARLRTHESFSFKYGHVEVVAKTPQADWLWPAIWLLPTQWKYGGWPRSGEIDLLESRGNEKYGNGSQIGVELVFSTLHFGPKRDQDHWQTAHYERNNPAGYDKDFHTYGFTWDQQGIQFFLDGTELGFAKVDEGFWKRGGFQGQDIWAQGTKMAPFDEEFHFIINLAVGANNGYFPDDLANKNGPKPWRNGSPTAMKDFWSQRNQWQKSWDSGDKSSLIVESVKVTAL